MAYRTTEHKKAIVKMVREKRVILQVDLAIVMNKKDIGNSIESLVNEGKINRQKIKVRGKVGNLTDMWVVYSNDVKQQEILDFEMTTISRPFTSPLEENHCYKSPENPVEQELKELKGEKHTLENSKVVDINKYININNTNIKLKEFKGQRVVTFKEIDLAHGRQDGIAKRRFNENKKRFIEGVDYYIAKSNEILTFDNKPLDIKLPNRGLTLITETGYMMLVKSFTDELSWDVQRQLVKSYFKIQEIKTMQENNIPITKQDLKSFDTYDFFRMVATGMTDLNDRVKSLESTIDSMKKAITG